MPAPGPPPPKMPEEIPREAQAVFDDFNQYLKAGESGPDPAEKITQAVQLMGLYKDWLEITGQNEIGYTIDEGPEQNTFGEFLAELQAETLKAMNIPPVVIRGEE